MTTYAVEAFKVLQYDGTNSAEVVGLLEEMGSSGTFSIVSETGGHLQVKLTNPSDSYEPTWDLDETDWITKPNYNVFTDADFQARFIVKE